MSPHQSTRPILIVDDELDLAATCERLLRRYGHRVLTSGSRHDALSLLALEDPRLLVCDVHLPDGDGLDVVRAARASAVPLPAIVMSGYVSHAAREDALEAGAQAYLAKPFAAAGFTAVVHEVLARTSGAPSPHLMPG